MHRTLFGISFGGIALAVLAGLHAYAWKRLVHDVRMPRPWRRGATVVVCLLAISLPTVFILGRSIDPARETGAAFLAYMWLGMLFYLVLGLATVDLLRVFAWSFALVRRKDRPTVVDPGRRLFLARAAAGSAVVGSAAIAVFGPREAGQIVPPEIEGKLPNLPHELSGFKNPHLAAPHPGPLLPEAVLEAA